MSSGRSFYAPGLETFFSHWYRPIGYLQEQAGIQISEEFMIISGACGGKKKIIWDGTEMDIFCIAPENIQEFCNAYNPREDISFGVYPFAQPTHKLVDGKDHFSNIRQLGAQGPPKWDEITFQQKTQELEFAIERLSGFAREQSRSEHHDFRPIHSTIQISLVPDLYEYFCLGFGVWRFLPKMAAKVFLGTEAEISRELHRLSSSRSDVPIVKKIDNIRELFFKMKTAAKEKRAEAPRSKCDTLNRGFKLGD